MTEWWNDLTLLKQIFYLVAVPSTIILVIQAILTMVGLVDMETDFDVDVGDGLDGLDSFDGLDGIEDLSALDEISDIGVDEQAFMGDFRFFTLRGIIAFFTVFGWLGASLEGKVHDGIAIVIALVGGFLAMVFIGYVFYGMTKLQSSGNIRYQNSIGKTGEVYLTIPPKRQGRGKIMITVQERLIEVSAITDFEEPIRTGDSVIVKSMLADHTMVVEKLT